MLFRSRRIAVGRRPDSDIAHNIPQPIRNSDQQTQAVRGRSRFRARVRQVTTTASALSSSTTTLRTTTTTATTTSTEAEATITLETSSHSPDEVNEVEAEYKFFPAESKLSKENFRQQQQANNEKKQVNLETQLETEIDVNDESLSEHLNSAINLATVTWTQDPYRGEEGSAGIQPEFDIDFSKNPSAI